MNKIQAQWKVFLLGGGHNINQPIYAFYNVGEGPGGPGAGAEGLQMPPSSSGHKNYKVTILTK